MAQLVEGPGFRYRLELGEVPARLERTHWPFEIRAGAVMAINMGASYLQRELYRNTPSGATGLARKSIIYEPPALMGFGVPIGFVGYGAPGSTYIGFVNDGTRPHTPPIAPLRLWAARKLGNARLAGAIWMKIRREGTVGQHFIERTYDRSSPVVLRLMSRVFTDFIKRGG